MNRKSIDEQVDRALSRRTEFELGPDFADRVIRKIEAKRAAEAKQSAYILAGSIVGFLVISGVCLGIFVEQEILQRILDVSGWGVIIGLLVVAVQVLDNRIVKKKPVSSLH